MNNNPMHLRQAGEDAATHVQHTRRWGGVGRGVRGVLGERDRDRVEQQVADRDQAEKTPGEWVESSICEIKMEF